MVDSMPEVQPGPEAKMSSGKVMVVDDEPAIVDMLKSMLSSENFDVTGFTDGAKAVEWASQNRPDVILSDLKMPTIDGLELLKRVRTFDSDVPVIFVSGNLTREALMFAITGGVSGVLEKPFKSVDVIQTCLQGVERSRMLRLLRKSSNLLLYQYSDLDEYLRSSGKSRQREILQREMTEFLKSWQALTVKRSS
jgi:CheY-like chemotaxis protein